MGRFIYMVRTIFIYTYARDIKVNGVNEWTKNGLHMTRARGQRNYNNTRTI